MLTPKVTPTREGVPPTTHPAREAGWNRNFKATRSERAGADISRQNVHGYAGARAVGGATSHSHHQEFGTEAIHRDPMLMTAAEQHHLGSLALGESEPATVY